MTVFNSCQLWRVSLHFYLFLCEGRRKKSLSSREGVESGSLHTKDQRRDNEVSQNNNLL